MNILHAASHVLPLLPVGAGDRRLANEVFRRQRCPVTVRTRLAGGAELELDTGQWPEAQALVLGRYDVSAVSFITSQLPVAGGTFFDVGAHVGLMAFQVLAARPNARIYSFEPHPEVAARYRTNNVLNNSRTIFSQLGLSNRPGTLLFDIATHSVGETGDTEIPVVTLDEFVTEHGVGSIDVLKLDVEGHERAVLEGASRTLTEGRIKAVTLEVMEAHGGDAEGARQLLLDAGFRQTTMPDPRPQWLARRRSWRPENAAYVCG